MTPARPSRASIRGRVVSWIVAIVGFFLALDIYLMLSHIPVGGPAALRTTVDMFAAAQGVVFFIAVQMADQAVLNSSTEARVWKREVRGMVSALVGVAIFVVVLVGLPRLLLG